MTTIFAGTALVGFVALIGTTPRRPLHANLVWMALYMLISPVFQVGILNAVFGLLIIGVAFLIERKWRYRWTRA